MLGLNLLKTEQPLKVLCLGAHCDDIEIGCGGTILELCQSRPVDVTWVVMCSNEIRAKEASLCAAQFLTDAERSDVRINKFRDGFLPYEGGQVKDYFESLKEDIEPNLIFTHFCQDKHQDHRLLSELTLNTFRNHFILEYEIPKYDGDIGNPNFYLSVSKKNSLKKIQMLHQHYLSQKNKNWFTEDLFYALMRLRGMEVNSFSNYAEAFYCHKINLKLKEL
ncbi:MAG: PIG-L family deacetylase [Candidatus Babeliaceae bacterium]|nr:PIG-L family deacetylase [Candidatus Babeliaceae bacterium]